MCQFSVRKNQNILLQMQFSNLFSTYVYSSVQSCFCAFCTPASFWTKRFKERMLWETNKNFKEACHVHWFNLTLTVPLSSIPVYAHTPCVYSVHRRGNIMEKFFSVVLFLLISSLHVHFPYFFRVFFLSVKLAYESWRERGGSGANMKTAKKVMFLFPKYSLYTVH